MWDKQRKNSLKFRSQKFRSLRFKSPGRGFYNLSFNSTKGSFSIETAIIFPIVLIIITALLYITFMLYIKTSTQTLADYSVRRGIKVWDDLDKDINTGKDIYQERYSVYWNIFDINKARKEEKLNNWLTSKLNGNPLLHKIDMDIDIQLNNYLTFKKLNAKVTAYYKTPINISKDEYIEIQSNSGAALNNPADFIRNTDFIIELEKELEQKYKSFGELMDKLRNSIEKITSGIERFGVSDL